jgi:hypothetical protein
MNITRKRPFLRAAGFALLGVAVAVAGGCKKPKAAVTGKVLLANKQPVTAGTVSFWSVSDNTQVGSSPISADGSYSVNDAPVGEVKITIVVPPPLPAMRGQGMTKAPPGLAGGMPADKMPGGPSGGEPPKAQNIVPVPDRYKDRETTTATWTVVESQEPQQHDIILDP